MAGDLKTPPKAAILLKTAPPAFVQAALHLPLLCQYHFWRRFATQPWLEKVLSPSQGQNKELDPGWYTLFSVARVWRAKRTPDNGTSFYPARGQE
ncbi:hypothetical protein K5I04_03295 [Murdochiella sp. Marseille-P8839]|nr:hypothetical protein [Murdochiella sp. Marseille-P8839]